MSAVTINKKFAKMSGKVGRKLGYKFTAYRSLDYVDPIDDRNKILDVDGNAVIFNMAYSKDDSFKSGPSAAFSPQKLYVNHLNLEVGDILVSETGTKITLVAKLDMREPVGIVTDDTINVSRTTYNTTGGFGPKGLLVYSDVPAKVLQTSTGGYGGVAGISSGMPDTTIAYNVWVWFPEDKPLLANDTIVFSSGKKAVINSIKKSDLGYELVVMEVE